MASIDKQINQVMQKVLAMVAPKGMTSSERRELAKAAGISHESLRTTLKRKTMNADTLIRLLLARGVSASSIENLPQSEASKLSRGELDWIELGRELSEDEKREFSSLIRYLVGLWKLTDRLYSFIGLKGFKPIKQLTRVI